VNSFAGSAVSAVKWIFSSRFTDRDNPREFGCTLKNANASRLQQSGEFSYNVGMRMISLTMLALVLVGCAPEPPMRAFTVPRTAEPSYAISGAIFPADAPVWFFKATGTTENITAVKSKLVDFFKTVRFPNGLRNAPVWDLPAGWTEGPARAMRYATIELNEKGVSISVSQASGNLAENVQRWIGQVGGTAPAAEATKPFTTTSGQAGVLVELTGPKNPAAGGMMMPPGS
jgi:hypothetical protein